MTASMVTPEQAKQKAAQFYDRHSRTWAVLSFMCEVEGSLGSEDIELAISLHPPTEAKVLEDSAAARRWVQSWHGASAQESIFWALRAWSRVGDQSVPEKIVLVEAEKIAAFAGRSRSWKTLCKRTTMLACRWQAAWRNLCPECDTEALPLALKKAAAAYEVLAEDDWNMLLLATDWLLKHPEANCYVRELPIRGIDTKWIESHRKAVYLLYAAFAGKPPTSIILKAPAQVRVRFLDDALAPGSLTDLAASPKELNNYTGSPCVAIICENLVSMMTLPALRGTVALCGGGYSVGDLSCIKWLAEIPVLYWGDLDSHGFAILSQWRHYHADTVSLMMDRETLAAHRELCVSEPSPQRGKISHLTEEEQAALQELLAGDTALRLEQERIEWTYALGQIKSALANLKMTELPS